MSADPANATETGDDVALAGGGLERELAGARAHLSLLRRVTTLTDAAGSYEHALGSALREVGAFGEWDVGHVYVRDGRSLHSSRIWHLPRSEPFREFVELTERTNFVWGQGLVGQVFKDAQPVWAPDVASDPNYVRRTDPMPLRSALAFPVLIGSAVVAVFELYSTRLRAADAEMLETAGYLGMQLGRFAERDRTLSELRESQAALTERIKELNTVYGVMQALSRDDLPLAQRIRHVADLLPSGWQYPEITEARVVVEDVTYATREFRETPWMLRAEIAPNGIALGRVEVCYTRERPPVDEGPFLLEEQTLLDSVARHVGQAVQRHRLERQLQQAQKMEAVGRLAGGIAHDFNNLLTGIGGIAHLLLMDTPDGDPRRRDLEEILRSTDRAAALTRQLLTFSRKQVVRPVELDVNEVLHRFREMLERLIGEDVRLELELVDSPLIVRIDESQFEQAVLNLVVNARDAMPQGGRVSIRTTTTRWTPDRVERAGFDLSPGLYVSLEVEDSGIGMDESVRRQIFEPFFTTKPAGKGTGLGLSTVYGIVKQAGGGVEVESEEGRGTTFRLLLPAAEDEAAEPPEPPPGVRQQTVLVVDDEAPVRRTVERILRRAGYRVALAENVAAAMLVLTDPSRPVHLLLTDVVMPDETGVDLMARARVERPELPVLLMSGFFEDGSKVVSRDDVAFIRKPFEPDALVAIVEELVAAPD